MVVALGPGRFYGRNLPRPRFYSDPMYNSTRVDPPESVSDPLMSWANEAHWSMGGLSFRRLRLQGSIEGSVAKLRGGSGVSKKVARFSKERLDVLDESEEEEDEEVYESEEEVKEESESEEEEVVVVVSKKRKRARRLGDEFDRIAEDVNNEKVNSKENKAKINKKKNKKKVEIMRRVSPRKK